MRRSPVRVRPQAPQKPVISKEITGFLYFLGHYNFSNRRVGVYLVFTLVFITADNSA